MRAKSYTVTSSAGGVSTSPAWPIDTYNNPCNIGIGVQVVFGTGSAVYDVQHTFTDPYAINLNSSANAGVWLNNSTLTSGTSTSDTNYAFPPRAIRFAIRAAASAQIIGTIVQAGPE